MTDDLMRELLAERYGPAPLRNAPRPAAVDGGPDTELTMARRRRLLCDALSEDVSQDFRYQWRSAS